MAIAIIGGTFVITLVLGTFCAIILSSEQIKNR